MAGLLSHTPHLQAVWDQETENHAEDPIDSRVHLHLGEILPRAGLQEEIINLELKHCPTGSVGTAAPGFPGGNPRPGKRSDPG